MSQEALEIISLEKWFNQQWFDYQNNMFITPENYSSVYNPFKNFGQIPEISDKVAFPIEQGGLAEVLKSDSARPKSYLRTGSDIEDLLVKALVDMEAEYVTDQSGLSACVFPSGMAAISSTLSFIIAGIDPKKRGNHKFIVDKNLYLHTEGLFSLYLPEQTGIGSSIFVDFQNENELKKVFKENKNKIAGIFYEPVSNPWLTYIDTRKVKDIAETILGENKVPIIVDNTFLTPYLQQQYKLGATIVIHSGTKYFSGKGDHLAGYVIAPARFINGFTKDFNSQKTKFVGMREYMVGTGVVVSSQSDYKNLLIKLLGFPERMKRHVTNCTKFNESLEKRRNDMVDEIFYTNLGNKTRDGSSGAVISFTLKGNKKEQYERAKAITNFVSDSKNPNLLSQSSLGERATLLFNLYGFDQYNLMRLAVGHHENVDDAINVLNKGFDYALNLKKIS